MWILGNEAASKAAQASSQSKFLIARISVGEVFLLFSGKLNGHCNVFICTYTNE